MAPLFIWLQTIETAVDWWAEAHPTVDDPRHQNSKTQVKDAMSFHPLEDI